MRVSLARRLAARADRLASIAAYSAATQIVASRHGVSPERITTKLSSEEAARIGRAARGRSELGPEGAVVAAKQEAIYLAVTVFGRGQRSIARVSNVSHTAVAKACQAVEERREDGGSFDRHLDELELELMGSAA